MSNVRNAAKSTRGGTRRSRFRFRSDSSHAFIVAGASQDQSADVLVGDDPGGVREEIPNGVPDCNADMEMSPLHCLPSLEGASHRLDQLGGELGQHEFNHSVDTMNATLQGDDDVCQWDVFHDEALNKSPGSEDIAAEQGGTVSEMGISLKVNNWRVLWGVLMISGSHKLTKTQYQSMRIIADTFRRIQFTGKGFWKKHVVSHEELGMPNENIVSLPHFSTLAYTYRKNILEFLTVRAIESEEAVDTSKAGARAKCYSADGVAKVPVLTVLPSEYARADLATKKVYDLMCTTSLSAFERQGGQTDHPAINAAECVDIWPIVAARKYFYGPPQQISVERDAGNGRTLISPFAEVGDTISLTVLGHTDFCQRFVDAFAPVLSSNGYVDIRGDIIAIWPIHHVSRMDTVGYEPPAHPELSSRDKAIIGISQFAEYRSPSDDITVDVPELPREGRNGPEDSDDVGPERTVGKKRRLSHAMQQALRDRREAMRRRERQKQEAWLNWRKPVIKPSDVACLLRPHPFHPRHLHARFLLIHRFWVENEERRRHIVWIPGDAVVRGSAGCEVNSAIGSLCHPFTDDPSDTTRDVIACRLTGVHSGPRGTLKYRPISSVGRLANGERYFIYRFMLFWDGFEVSKGRSASGDGFYLVCLNLPVKTRASANAVRIMTLSPPGVKSDTVFRRIQADIIQGMTEGFIDYDATGAKCRVFLDLVGFLGDTPAINSVLDTLGHTGTACCHLCRYTKRSTCHLGSRYAGNGTNGQLTGTGRSSFIHTAIRDCNAQKETCRLLGMKPTPDNSDLPLHSLRNAMLEARSRIPKTSNGLPILTGYLDPYNACCIAPDHLLTGHLRDCLNLAFRLLPTVQCRANAETYMLGFLTDCNLNSQNRLFDADSKTLFAMSMTDLYSLSIVAEFSFLRAFQSLASTPHPTVGRKSMEAISLVGSICRLIAALWRIPSAGRDSDSILSSFNVLHGARYISRLRDLVDRHLSLVRALCELSEGKVRALEEGTLTPTIRTELMKEQTICLLAKRMIDKPNVHRLVELVSTTLPMVGHVSRVGELVLEKTHQTLKRAIRQGNNKDIHMLSLAGAIFNDWEGRLNSQVSGVMSGDALSTLGFFRLLSGREAVAAKKAKLTASDMSQVRHVLGPTACIPTVLNSNNCAVYSTRADPEFLHGLSWHLTGDMETISAHGVPSDTHRARARTEFQQAHTFYGPMQPQQFGNNLKAFARNGTPVLGLKVGNVIEFLCYKPKDIHFHTPFVVHRQSIGNIDNIDNHEGPAMWAISALFRVASKETCNSFWAALRPCTRAPGVPAPNGFYRFNFPHFVHDTVSFARVGVFMRPVAVLHDCSALCAPSPDSHRIIHVPPSPLHTGAVFFPITSAHGYPPRRG